MALDEFPRCIVVRTNVELLLLAVRRLGLVVPVHPPADGLLGEAARCVRNGTRHLGLAGRLCEPCKRGLRRSGHFGELGHDYTPQTDVRSIRGVLLSIPYAGV